MSVASFYLHLNNSRASCPQEMARQIAEIDAGKWRSPVVANESVAKGSLATGKRIRNSAFHECAAEVSPGTRRTSEGSAAPRAIDEHPHVR